jgi:hypothetical protein
LAAARGDERVELPAEFEQLGVGPGRLGERRCCGRGRSKRAGRALQEGCGGYVKDEGGILRPSLSHEMSSPRKRRDRLRAVSAWRRAPTLPQDGREALDRWGCQQAEAERPPEADVAALLNARLAGEA